MPWTRSPASDAELVQRFFDADEPSHKIVVAAPVCRLVVGLLEQRGHVVDREELLANLGLRGGGGVGREWGG